MSCLAGIPQLLVWFVVLWAVVTIIRILIAWAIGVPPLPTFAVPGRAPGAPIAGLGGVLIAVLDVVIWAVVVIAVIYFVWTLLSCLISFAGMPHFPR